MLPLSPRPEISVPGRIVGSSNLCCRGNDVLKTCRCSDTPLPGGSLSRLEYLGRSVGHGPLVVCTFRWVVLWYCRFVRGISGGCGARVVRLLLLCASLLAGLRGCGLGFVGTHLPCAQEGSGCSSACYLGHNCSFLCAPVHSCNECCPAASTPLWSAAAGRNGGTWYFDGPAMRY